MERRHTCSSLSMADPGGRQPACAACEEASLRLGAPFDAPELPQALRPRRLPDLPRLERIGRDLLDALGEDPDDPRVAETPARWARMWGELLTPNLDRIGTSFESPSDEMVVVGGIRVWSFCEHHLVPFWVDAAIGYIPKGRVLGLSKLARVAQAAASRLQLQERLTGDIADAIAQLADTPDVAVILQGQHLCMTMRGARTEALTTTSAMRGRFRDPATRAEFMSIARTR